MMVCVGNPSAARFYTKVEDIITPDGAEIYFGPALRSAKDMHKEAVLGSRAIWLDIDDVEEHPVILPPTYRVFSGHGWHYYWMLREPVYDRAYLEQLNQAVTAHAGGDDCWNANRILRVPGSMNLKSTPVSVELRMQTKLLYDAKQIEVAFSLPEEVWERIRTGSVKGFKSRSERDFGVLRALAQAGADFSLAQTIFQHHKIGEKANEANPSYLQRTWENASNFDSSASRTLLATPKTPRVAKAATDIVVRPQGTFRGFKQLSTFSFEPDMLIDGSYYGDEDVFVGTMKANGFEWPNVTLPRKAFTSVNAFNAWIKVMAWQWLGSDPEIRQYGAYLMDQVISRGLKRVVGTPVMGLHEHKGTYHLATDCCTVTPTTVFKGNDGPLVWIPKKTEHPQMSLTDSAELTDADRAFLTTVLPSLNDAEVMWPALGWFLATPFKPWLEARNKRFPILNVTGTRGSGKTTLILRQLMPLLGQLGARSYDANTTRFVTLMLLGSTNNIPISFSEYREDHAASFLRYILLSYDSGMDARGRADQTTQQYPLTAPFVVDGEDLISDPAAQQRMVVAQLRPAMTQEGTPAHRLWSDWRYRIPRAFPLFWYQTAIRTMHSGLAAEVLKDAEMEIQGSFPKNMPDRIRSNHVVAWFGAKMFCHHLGAALPSPLTMGRSITTVCNLETGRARTTCDDFVESLVAECALKRNSPFPWAYDKATGYLRFQLKPAFDWWLGQRRRLNQGALQLPAVRSQLLESGYYGGSEIVNGAAVHKISLVSAATQGLDVVTSIDANKVEVIF